MGICCCKKVIDFEEVEEVENVGNVENVEKEIEEKSRHEWLAEYKACKEKYEKATIQEEKERFALQMSHALDMWRSCRIGDGVVDRTNEDGEYVEVVIQEGSSSQTPQINLYSGFDEF